LFRYIVIDSVNGQSKRTFQQIWEWSINDANIGQNAKAMKKLCWILQANMSEKWTTCIFINQLKQTIGTYISTRYMPGWTDQIFTASLILETSINWYIKRGDNIIGKHIKVKVYKTKVGNDDFRTTDFWVYDNHGISRSESLYNLGEKLWLINNNEYYNEDWEVIKLGRWKEDNIMKISKNVNLYDTMYPWIRQRAREKNALRGYMPKWFIF
jgi:recombination protein RecA